MNIIITSKYWYIFPKFQFVHPDKTENMEVISKINGRADECWHTLLNNNCLPFKTIIFQRINCRSQKLSPKGSPEFVMHFKTYAQYYSQCKNLHEQQWSFRQHSIHPLDGACICTQKHGNMSGSLPLQESSAFHYPTATIQWSIAISFALTPWSIETIIQSMMFPEIIALN